MKIRIAGKVMESCSNGEGMRNVIFFSGCHRGCKNCHNKEMQSESYGELVEVDDIVKELLNFKSINYIDGVTVSGGEPFEQPKGLRELLTRLKQHSINVWVYTGFTYEELKQPYKEILKLIDVLVDGDYREDVPSLKRYMGSGNQRILKLREGEVIEFKRNRENYKE